MSYNVADRPRVNNIPPKLFHMDWGSPAAKRFMVFITPNSRHFCASWPHEWEQRLNILISSDMPQTIYWLDASLLASEVDAAQTYAQVEVQH